MARIVITGGAGLLGLNWAIHLRASHEVHIWTHHRDIQLNGVQVHKFNACDEDEIDANLLQIRPDIVINTIGFTNVDECEKNPPTIRRSEF